MIADTRETRNLNMVDDDVDSQLLAGGFILAAGASPDNKPGFVPLRVTTLYHSMLQVWDVDSMTIK